MSLSTAINIYLKKLGREKRIPFEVAVDSFEATGGTVHEVDFEYGMKQDKKTLESKNR